MVIEQPEIYIPMDRRHALARGESLPDQTHGAALFADISGFTALTSTLLEELGLKRGSEELPRLLNLVYEALIDEIHRYHGCVIGFAGDAITCWFDGDNGTLATACALSMQRAMAQFKAFETSAGALMSLQLKVAIETGPARRFQVGDPAIQLLDTIAGVTLERMADGEHHAKPGDVIVGPNVVKTIGELLSIADNRLDEKSGVEFAKVTGLTQSVSPRPWPAISSDIDEEIVRSWLLPPVYSKLQTSGSEFLAEIRPSVALFLRFGGIDFDHDPGAGKKLDLYVRWIQQVLLTYESYVMDITIGDKGCYIYGSFGSPELHDDDPARAVAAALDIQSPPAELSYIGPVQIGISQGRMRAGSFGSQLRRAYGSLGNEVNMAARLMGKATPGQIIVSRRIVGSTASLYEFQDLGLVEVKGTDEPISIAQVLGRKQHAATDVTNRFRDQLVAREQELTQLKQVLATTEIEQSGQILRIEGVAGIGKSHLTTAFAEHAIQRDWQAIMGTCHSVNQNISYHPWRQIFRSLFGLEGQSVARDSAAVREQVEAINSGWLVRLPLLGDLLEQPIPDNATTAAFEPQLRQEALFTFAVDLIRHWAEQSPLLVLIEDAHWLDESSHGLLIALSRVVNQSPLILTVVHRPPLDAGTSILAELDNQPNYHHIPLDELDTPGVASVIAHRINGQPSQLLIDLIMAQARGNPFFVEEMTNNLLEIGHLVPLEDGQWSVTSSLQEKLRLANCLQFDQRGEVTLNPGVPISAVDLGLPDSVQQIVLTRLDRLDEEERLTLKVASVIGRLFEFRLLHQAHPLEDDPKRVHHHADMLEAREFTQIEVPIPNLSYLFKHNITRDVTYETLLESQQQELHQSVGEAIELHTPDATEQLAYHYVRAGNREKSLLYLGESAHKAQREYANETALAFYAQALEMEERWAWRKGQIEVLHLLARREEEQIALEQLEAISDAPPFEVAFLWGQYYEVVADYGRAQVAVERALGVARREQDRLNEIQCLGQLGLIARRLGDYEVAKGWYEGSLVDFDLQQKYSTQEAHIFTQILNGLGVVHRQQGEGMTAQKFHMQALELSRTSSNISDEAETLNNLGASNFYRRRFNESLSYHQQALEIRRSIGDRSGEGTSLFNIALVYQGEGNYGYAQGNLSEALIIQQATGNRWEEANVWNGMGIVFHLLGNYTKAESCLQEGLKLTRDINDESGQAYILCNLGLAARDKGDLEKARTLLNNGLALAQAQDDKYLTSIYFSYLGETYLRLGNIDTALEVSHRALQIRQANGMRLFTPDDLTTIASALLVREDISQSLKFVEQAFDILVECNGEGPEFPERDYLVCYRAFSEMGQKERAENALRSAYGLVTNRAKNITDLDLRKSFLNNVAINREIVSAFEISGLAQQ